MGGRPGMSLLDRVRALLGDDAVEIAGGPEAVPRVAPPSPDAVALLLGTARQEGWRVRLEGTGTWLPADAPADLALTTRRLDRVPAIEPQDLSATAEAGIGCDLLRQQLADRGTWLALDPPGLAGRTLGSVVATATAGPLRQGFGAVRDHVLGVTFVTGDGRLVQSGGRVVKHVAGDDLTQLEAGGRELRGPPRRVPDRRAPGLKRRAARPVAASGGRRMGVGEPRRRGDPLGGGHHGRPVAPPAAHARGARGAAHPGARPLVDPERGGPLRRLSRRRGPARRWPATHLRPRRSVCRGSRRLRVKPMHV